MGSLGSGELIVIAIVALIVFGPKRLPELARKASELLAKTREATRSVTTALDTEYDGITAPLQDLKTEYDSTVKEIKGVASTATNFSVDLTDVPSSSKKKTKPLSDGLEAADEATAKEAPQNIPPDTESAGDEPEATT